MPLVPFFCRRTINERSSLGQAILGGVGCFALIVATNCQTAPDFAVDVELRQGIMMMYSAGTVETR